MVVSWNDHSEGQAAAAGVAVPDTNRIEESITTETTDADRNNSSRLMTPETVPFDDSLGGDVNKKATILCYLALRSDWEELTVRLQNVSSDVLFAEYHHPVEMQSGTLLHLVSKMPNVPSSIISNILECSKAIQSRKIKNHEHKMKKKAERSSAEAPIGMGHDPSNSGQHTESLDHSTCHDLASMQNTAHQTPLHLAVSTMPDRTNVIDMLYQASPCSAKVRDVFGWRPIDIITQKIIMIEEVIKYSSPREKIRCQNTLVGLWETTKVLVGLSSSSCNTSGYRSAPRGHYQSVSFTSYLVHACLCSREIPFALTERAMKYNPDQLYLPDSNGDLPLHIVARTPPRSQRSTKGQAHTRSDEERSHVDTNEEKDSEEDQDDEEESTIDEGDFLQRVLELNLDAAFHFNNDREIPLVVAIRAGRKWESGISQLLCANSAGIQETKLSRNLYPYLFERLSVESGSNIVYHCLRCIPGLFHGTT